MQPEVRFFRLRVFYYVYKEQMFKIPIDIEQMFCYSHTILRTYVRRA